ncbi:MAG: hypothetical protein KJ000_08830, partial [Pirellulaceae bacterium]|nr:hypothetical protein [Pirellulaceae bacterium]
PEMADGDSATPTEPEDGPPDSDAPSVVPEQGVAPPAEEPANEEPRDASPPAADGDAAKPED